MHVSTELRPNDEGFHEPGPEQQWSDSLYLGGAGDSGLALYSRIGRRPGEDRIEGAFGVWLPDGRFALSFARDPDRDEPAAGAIAFDCTVPFELWRIRLDGPARLFDRPEDLADAFRPLLRGGHFTLLGRTARRHRRRVWDCAPVGRFFFVRRDQFVVLLDDALELVRRSK